MKNPQFVGEVRSLSGRLVIDSAGNLLPPVAGNGRVFYVDSTNGNNAFDGFSSLTAKATLANIAGTLRAQDIVYLAPGHAETISAAAGVAITASNVRIYGMGSENEKPVFTFNGVVGATFAVTGNNVAVVNIAGLGALDGLTNPFNITGDDFYGDIEWRDGSAAIEALRAVRLDTANRCYLKLKYNGFTAGDATANAVRLDDCDHVRIDLDAFGRVDATGWVEMVDVASLNVVVYGRAFCQAVTNGSRDIIDTIMGSSWYGKIDDLSAGSTYSGGSGAAWANDDVSGLAAAIDAVDNMLDTEFPVVATAVGAVADAALADTIEGAAAATQSIVTDLKGVLQRLGADNANNTSATTLVAANRDGSILERLEDIRQSEGFSAGLVYQGATDAGMGASTVTVVSADLSGHGNDFFNNKYYMMVLLNASTPAGAPESEVRQITDYVSATGTFTVTAFSVNVEAADEILIMHESLVLLGRDDANNTMATTNVVANTDGSVLERLEFIQQAVGGTDSATNVLGANDADNQYDSSAVVANLDGSVLERLEDIVVKVTTVDDLLDTEIGVITGFHGVPGADVVTNAQMRDVVGNKTDAAAAGDVSAVESLMAYAKQAVTELSGTAGITTFPAAAAPANGVALADVMREVYDQADKSVVNTTATLVDGTTIFTVAGGPIEILSLVARCVTGNDGTASTLQWRADPTDGALATFSAASASLADALAGATVALQGTTLATAALLNATGVNLGQQVTNGIIIGAGVIQIVVGAGSTTGTWQHHLRYRPLSRGVVVS